MASRLDLQALLVGLGFSKVYFEPESNITMEFPCIRYELDDIYQDNAANKAYVRQKRYSVTAISTNPDDPLFEVFADLPLCRFDRSYRADHLYHQVYELYF